MMIIDNESTQPEIRFEPVTEGAVIPTRATEHSAGYDLSCLQDEVFESGVITVVRTGIRIHIPSNYCVLVVPRSGLALKHGITIINAPGLIDADYKGEIHIIATKLSYGVCHLPAGNRVAQLLVVPYAKGSDVVLTKRTGGLGSTDKGPEKKLHAKASSSEALGKLPKGWSKWADDVGCGPFFERKNK